MNEFTIISIAGWFFLYLLTVKTILFLMFSRLHYINTSFKVSKDYNPKVSIIVPCYNESLTLANCIEGLITQNYKNFDVLIVDDGSKDNTKEVAYELVNKYPKKLKLLAKENGGKGSALNYGIAFATGEIVVTVDADSVFTKTTLENIVASFNGTDIVAVGGNVKVSNRGNLLTIHQTLEYISGLTLLRRCFAYLGCMQVIAGAIGAFKRDKLIEVGGYSPDTIVEDMDITVELVKRGYRVDYNSAAVAYTEAPETLKDFIKQRYRWVYGGFQVMQKHKEVFFNPKYGELGMIGMPYFLIFPWLEVATSFLFLFVMGEVLLFGRFAAFLAIFALTTGLQFVLLLYILHIDHEDKKLSLVSVIQGFWYSHLINLITISAAIAYIRGTKTSWNKVARLGKNTVISPA